MLPLLALLAACGPCNGSKTFDELEVTTGTGTSYGATITPYDVSGGIDLDASGRIVPRVGGLVIAFLANGGSGYSFDATAVTSALAGVGDLRHATQVLSAGTTFSLPTAGGFGAVPELASLDATVADDPSAPLTLLLDATAEGTTLNGVAQFAVEKQIEFVCD